MNVIITDYCTVRITNETFDAYELANRASHGKQTKISQRKAFHDLERTVSVLSRHEFLLGRLLTEI